MALPEDHLVKFHKMTNAKDIWDAIKSRFGGNDESRRCRTHIKQQYSVSIEDPIRRFLILNLFPVPSILSHADQARVDSPYFDDLYNNLRVFESDVKGSTGSSLVATHNENSSSYTNELMYSFFANQSSGLQLDHEDLEQLDEFDLEEMDLKWQVAMISMRLKKFYKMKGRSLQFDAKELVSFDNTKTGHAEDEQENFALMAYSNSGSDTENNSTKSKIFKSKVNTAEVKAVNAVGGKRETAVKPSAVKSSKAKNACEEPNKNPDLKTDEKPVDKEDQEFAKDTKDLLLQEGAAKASSTNTVNTASTPVSNASPYGGLSFTDTDQDDSKIPALEDMYDHPTHGIFTNASYDNEGALADFTNLETIVNVSPIPTSRINSIHLSNLILGDPNSSIRNNHKDFQHCLFVCFLSQNEPKKISVGLEDESWVDAMQEELQQFKIHKVCILVDLPYRKKAIGTKWVYRNKKDERGVVVRNKARLVAQGHSAFLYGKIDKEVYVSQPPGFVDPKYPKKVYKVVKALYGLHQAPKASYATLSTFLLKSRYRRGTIDKTLFIKKDKNDIILVQVYVYDIIFGFTKSSWCDEFEALMKSRFQMSSMGELTFFLGLQTASTPIETQKPLVRDEEASDMDVYLYRSMISSLMYLTTSRPDIIFVVCACSRFQVTPKTSHLNVVKRIFRQVLWIQNQMLDYGFNFINTKTLIDNESTICIVKNPVFHYKTKHITIRHHFIRDAYEKKLIQVLKIHTDDNVADLLTKAFDVNRESLKRDIDGTEELLLPDLFILWLTKVSTVEIKALYDKIKRSDDSFIAIGSAEDEKVIKEMNEQVDDASKKRVKKDDSIKGEIKEEKGTRKRKLGIRKKMKPKKRKFTSKDDDELRLCLTIVSDEDKEVDYEILDKKYPIIEWRSEYLTTKPQYDETEEIEDVYLNVVIRSNRQRRYFSTLMAVLSILDRDDICAIYQLVMNRYQDETPEGFDKILWGDLIIMFNQSGNDEFWNAQQNWKIVSWKLHSSSGIHTIMTDEGIVIHMLVENKYPLKKEVLSQLLKLKLETEEDSTMALELIRFVKKQIAELEPKDSDGDEKDL
ncbi:putative ribonuclease H-like domain-containing protein [Tanacetum coccineum]